MRVASVLFVAARLAAAEFEADEDIMYLRMLGSHSNATNGTSNVTTTPTTTPTTTTTATIAVVLESKVAFEIELPATLTATEKINVATGIETASKTKYCDKMASLFDSAAHCLSSRGALAPGATGKKWQMKKTFTGVLASQSSGTFSRQLSTTSVDMDFKLDAKFEAAPQLTQAVIATTVAAASAQLTAVSSGAEATAFIAAIVQEVATAASVNVTVAAITATGGSPTIAGAPATSGAQGFASGVVAVVLSAFAVLLA